MTTAALTIVSSARGAELDDEAVYMQRFEQLSTAMRTGLGLDSYQPLEAVPGNVRHRPLPLATSTQQSIAAGALTAADAYAERNHSIALLVYRSGRLELARYYRGYTPERSFPSRSLAKPMTVIAVGRALALGKIKSLDQPVAEFIGEWRGDPRRSKILVRHLLDMRSGFLPQAAATRADDILNRAYLHPRHDEIILRDYPVVDDPGTRFEYNNATSEMVAIVIERATGRRYAEFLSREVLQPLAALGGEVWIDRPNGMAHSGCCLMIPPESWLRLAILVMQDGVWRGRRLLPRGFVTEMTRATRENPYYGLGIYVAGNYIERRGFANPQRELPNRGVLHSEPYLAGDLVLFDGNANQVVYIVPSEQLVILRMGDNPPRRDGSEWDNSYLPNIILRGLKRRLGAVPPQPRG